MVNKLSKKIFLSVVTFCIIVSAVSCGNTENPEQAETTTSVVTTAANIKVKNEQVGSVIDSGSTYSNSDEIGLSGDAEDLSAEEAINLMLNGVKSIADKDLDKMFEYTNFVDVFYMTGDSMTEYSSDEILGLMKENKDNFDWSGIDENAEVYQNMTKADFEKPVHMTQEDINGVLEILNQLADASDGKKKAPVYVDGYKASFFNSGDIAHMYVFKNEQGTWKYDICFGMMRDGLSILKGSK